MRRLLVILLLTSPAAAWAQTAGQIVFDGIGSSVWMNKYGCVAPGADMPLAWSTLLENAVSWPFNTSGEYRVYAASADKGTTNPFCETVDNGTVKAGRLTTTPVTVPATKQLVDSSAGVSVNSAEIAAKAGFDCTANATVYVCVLWYPAVGDTTPRGYAKGTIQLKVIPPGAPTITSVTPGDGALNVTITPAAATGDVPEAVTWVALAVPVDAPTSTPILSSEVPIGTSARITGLQNARPYSVIAATLSAERNVSLDSAAVVGTPQLVRDAWGHYVDDGGVDSGGCGSGPSGVLALLGAAGLLRLRRRA